MSSLLEVAVLIVAYLGLRRLAWRRRLQAEVFAVLVFLAYLVVRGGTQLAVTLGVAAGWWDWAGIPAAVATAAGAALLLATVPAVRNSVGQLPSHRAATLHVTIGVLICAVAYLGVVGANESSLAWLLFAFVAWHRGRVLLHSARRLRHPSAAEALARDQRKPVLWLRSFELDRAVRNPEDATALSLEAQLAPLMYSRLAPMVALEDPEAIVPDEGAIRERVAGADSEWIAVVRRYAHRAWFVLMLAGGKGKGLEREIELLKNEGLLGKLILMTAPNTRATRRWHERSWPAFSELLRSLPVAVPADPGPGALVRYRPDGTTEVMTTSRKSASELVRVLATIPGGVSISKEDRSDRPVRWFPFRSATLVAFLVGLLAVLPIAVDPIRAVSVGALGMACLAVAAAEWRFRFHRETPSSTAERARAQRSTRYAWAVTGLILCCVGRFEWDASTSLDPDGAVWLNASLLTLALATLLAQPVCAGIFRTRPDRLGDPNRIRSAGVKMVLSIVPAIAAAWGVANVLWLANIVGVLNVPVAPNAPAFEVIAIFVLLLRYVAGQQTLAFDPWTGEYDLLRAELREAQVPPPTGASLGRVSAPLPSIPV